MSDGLYETRELLCRLMLKAVQAQVFERAILSKPADKEIKRVVLTPMVISGTCVLQAETFHTDNKATHENIRSDDGERFMELTGGFGQINLFTTAGECEYRVSKSGKCVIIGGSALERELFSEKSHARVTLGGNNRKKSYILHGDEEFLKLLGVSDDSGRVYDKKQAKFRQINKFLEHVRDIEQYLPRGGVLKICDLCCGKSYLSFAVYYYFAVIRNRQVSMTGVDMKADVIEYCSQTAQRLGFDGLEFIYGDIRDKTPEGHIHLVISLHACDIATDIVLGKAAECGADVILSTPCCHHDLNKKLDCEALSFISSHSMLRQKFCDAATDALRLKLLEAKGYEVSALELIDPEQTPKNILLRGIKRKDFVQGSEEQKRYMEQYLSAYAYLTGKAPDFM